jgi:hypothetical protein
MFAVPEVYAVAWILKYCQGLVRTTLALFEVYEVALNTSAILLHVALSFETWRAIVPTQVPAIEYLIPKHPGATGQLTPVLIAEIDPLVAPGAPVVTGIATAVLLPWTVTKSEALVPAAVSGA